MRCINGSCAAGAAAAVLALGAAASAQAAVLLNDGDASHSSYGYDVHVYSINGQYESFRDYIYSDFAVPLGQTWTVDGMFGTYANADPNAATTTPNFQYEVRTGMSGSNPGTLLYSGNNLAATGTSLGYTVPGGFPSFQYSASLPTPLVLPGGVTYWFCFVPISLNGYNIFSQSSTEANTVNSLMDNASEYLNWDYISQTDNYSATTGDYAVGLTGSAVAVPEPACAAAAVLAGAALWARRRRGRAN